MVGCAIMVVTVMMKQWAFTAILFLFSRAVDCFSKASFLPTRRDLEILNRPSIVTRDTSPTPRERRPRRSNTSRLEASMPRHDQLPTTESFFYRGPIWGSSLSPEPPQLKAVLQLQELGIEIAVGTSVVSPGQIGLLVRCSDHVESVTLPECTLLCGYAKPGTYQSTNHGDKTVGFHMTNSQTAVFFEQKLQTMEDALQQAAIKYGRGTCGLAGHELSMTNEDTNDITIHPIEGFNRFFCPDLVNSLSNDNMPINVQNFGQFCNDLAWDFQSPPTCLEDYMNRSSLNNCVQLVWRLEYDDSCHCLVPSWPVSVLSRDVTFDNHDFMELGTHYGWGYWQATVDLEKWASLDEM